MNKLKSIIIILLLSLPVGVVSQSLSTMTDARDSKVYSIVDIGTQTWMAENLNYYTATFSKYYANDSSYYSDTYGRLYPWYVADTICPSGYHLPTDAEWIVLEAYLGMSSVDQSLYGYRDSGSVGEVLKSSSELYWAGYGKGSDDYNFTALPGGLVRGSSFSGMSYNAYFWVDGEHANTYQSLYRSLYYSYKGVGRDYVSQSRYMSVRCLKD
jgi:uncharacterized protein (TIGR02145 family)